MDRLVIGVMHHLMKGALRIEDLFSNPSWANQIVSSYSR